MLVTGVNSGPVALFDFCSIVGPITIYIAIYLSKKTFAIFAHAPLLLYT
jgi:hypothetical protein